MHIASGTYTGTGVAQSVSGIGFTPKAVFIKGGANIMVARTDTMATDSAKAMTGATALATDRVTSLDATGFTVGTDAQVNANTVAYFWLALGDSGGVDIETGSYAGDGNDDRSISLSTLSAKTPNVVMVFASTTDGAPYIRTSDMSTDDVTGGGHTSQPMDNADSGNKIQSIGSGAFVIGTAVEVNQAVGTPTFHWLALVNVAGFFKVFTYVGNSTQDDRTITGAGFQPETAWTKRDNSASIGVIKFKSNGTNVSYPVSNVDVTANEIQAWTADGFQIGTSSRVNATSANYYVVAFKDVLVTAGGGSGGGGQGGGRSRPGPRPGSGNGGNGGPGKKPGVTVSSRSRKRLYAGVL